MYILSFDLFTKLFSLSQAFCEPGKVEGNGVLAFAQHVIFPVLASEGIHGVLCVVIHT